MIIVLIVAVMITQTHARLFLVVRSGRKGDVSVIGGFVGGIASGTSRGILGGIASGTSRGLAGGFRRLDLVIIIDLLVVVRRGRIGGIVSRGLFGGGGIGGTGRGRRRGRRGGSARGRRGGAGGGVGGKVGS